MSANYLFNEVHEILYTGVLRAINRTSSVFKKNTFRSGVAMRYLLN